MMLKRKKNVNPKKALYFMLLIFVLPLFFAIIAKYNYENIPHRYVNKGEFFVTEYNLNDIVLYSKDGTTFDASKLRGKWHIIHLLDNKCSPICKRYIFELGQLENL